MLLQNHFQATARSLAATARSFVDNVVVFEEIDSTQACALRLVEQAESEEIVLPTTLVIAAHQRSGRGRSGRRWESPHGGLYLSWISSGLDREVIPRIPMIAAAAAAAAVAGIGIDNVTIKWPNDLLIEGCKLAGLLVHARHGETTWVTVGLGINIGLVPETIGPGAIRPTSVAKHLPADQQDQWMEQLVEVFVEEMAAGVAAPQEPLRRWRENIVHRPGDAMVVKIGDGSELKGRFVGLNDEGHLRLDCDGAERIISTGDVVE